MKGLAIFDFDGTLVDTSRGVFAGVNYALEAMGRPRDTDRAHLSRMIGPPIEDGFAQVYGITDPAVVEHFRVYYRSQGVREYEPYPGMEALLRRLKAAGVRLAIATMKPEVFTRAILAELGWSGLFDGVKGVSLAMPAPAKSGFIAALCEELGVAPADAVMIGDRTSDVAAGKAAGVSTLYCRYGFGAPGEAELSGAAAIADTVEEIERLLLA